ncbi:glycoside hydrolase family 97 protein [Mangrovibacterium marinum]|nr:glycoside hydrolase family 97 protein [Mangrovibacterium marinum]
MMKHLLLFIAFTLAVAASRAGTVVSPNGDFQLSFSLNGKGTPVYELRYKGKTLIGESAMGVDIHAGYNLKQNFELVAQQTDSKDELWQPVMGEQKEIRNHYNEYLVQLKQDSTGFRMDIRFRLFDDGLGFRYEFPVQPILRHFIIKKEYTQFKLGEDYKAFWMPGDFDSNEYPTNTSKLSEIRGMMDQAKNEGLACQSFADGLAVQTPLMLKSPEGVYVNIHEAALVNYPAMVLNVDDKDFVLSAQLAPDYEGNKAYLQTGSVSPWRTIVASDDARDILASNLILNLNEPCIYSDTSWIKPCKYIGVWWEYFTGGGSTWAYTDELNIRIGQTDYTKLKPNGHHGANTEHVKEYIDFAAANGFDAVLVEGWNEGWEDNWAYMKEHIYSFTKAYPDFDVEELHRYAAAKGVKIIMHHETTSSVLDYERQMNDAFQFMVDHGYSAVKTGYVGKIIPRGEHHDGQWMVNHYLNVVKTAADYKIMVNSHEAVRPTGLHRTYPNWIAQESARGTEFESFNGNRPDHTTILPFTRLMGGPMDYTPGIFEGDLSVYGNNKAKLSTTLTKQLALYVTMYSPLQMAADLIENYRKYPDAFRFIKEVEVDWDETHILEAEPGDYITIARKAKGKDAWFVGGITDENAREAKVDFSFLPKGRKYRATIYADAKDADYQTNPKAYTIRTVKVNSKTVLKQRLARSGGFAISLFPAD